MSNIFEQYATLGKVSNSTSWIFSVREGGTVHQNWGDEGQFRFWHFSPFLWMEIASAIPECSIKSLFWLVKWPRTQKQAEIGKKRDQFRWDAIDLGVSQKNVRLGGVGRSHTKTFAQRGRPCKKYLLKKWSGGIIMSNMAHIWPTWPIFGNEGKQN